MARTTEQILAAFIAQTALQHAQIQAQLEAAREEIAALKLALEHCKRVES